MNPQSINLSDYVVVFDISRESYNGWWAAVIPLVFVCVGIFLVVVEGRRWFGAAIAAGGMLFMAVWLVTTFAEYRKLRDDLRQDHAQSVEGYVSNFRPDDGAGHVPETFSVRGVAFSVSRPMVSAAFRRTVSAGGPNLTDACVRILYVRDLDENKILWLGLRRSSCPDS